MSINYSEQILDSVQILTTEALKKVTFDRTEICEIISQDQQMPAKYLVSNDNLKFYAYSDDEDKEYKEGSKVYVRIPNGDYNLEKVITGKYSADESTQLLYTNPFDDLVSSKSLQLLEGQDNCLTLTINSSVQQNNTITKPISFSYNKSTPFNYLGFDCGFDTMSLYGQYKGTYKVFIELLDSNQTPLIECDLYSTDLYGNPYSLVPNLTFQHLFNFDQDLDITLIKYARITLKDCGGFGFEDLRQIFLTSATLYFGYAKDEIFSIGEEGDSDSLTLVLKSDPTTSGMEYSKSPHENLNRTVFLEWNYNDSLGIPHIFNEDQLPDLDLFHEYHIYWMQYTNNINHKVSGLPDEYCWKWKQVETDTDKAFRCNFELNNNYANDQYRVVIKYKIDEEDKDYQYIQSDGLIFKSKVQTTTVETASQVRESLRIVLKDSGGMYNYYGLDGHITDSSLTGPYRIGFEFYDSMSATDIESVEWFFPPEENSMIVFDSLENNTGIYETFEECDAYFNIKKKHSGAEMNNTIRCRVQLQSQEREGSITLNFGEASTSGSNYGLNIDFIGNKNCLYALGDGIEDSLRVQATLTKDNDIIPDVGGADVTWEWVNASSEDFPIQCLPAGQTATLSYRGSKVEICYSILKATIKDYPLDNGLTSTLCAFLQVPIAKGYDVETNNYSYISGPSRVIYGPDNKTYTKSEQGYNLYIKNNNNPVPNVYWRLETAETTNIPQLEGSLPITVWSEDYSRSMQFFSNGCTLLPANYNSKELPAINVVAYSSASLGATVLWSQPLLIMSNKWYSSAINEWNGTVEVDENGTKGSIKAPYFLAGLKNDNNTFSGVVIGDLHSADLDVRRNTTGIYGFKNGQNRFQLTDNGYFFVGTGPNNYISFNETTNGGSESERLVIKTKDLIIDTNNFLLNSTVSNKEDSILEVNQGYKTVSKGKGEYYHKSNIYIPITRNEDGNIILSDENGVEKDTEGNVKEYIKNTTFQILGNGATKLAGWRVTTEEILGGNATKSTKTGMGINDYFFAGAGRYQRPGYKPGGEVGDVYPYLTRKELETFLSNNQSYGKIEDIKFNSGYTKYTFLDISKDEDFDKEENKDKVYKFYDGPTSGFTNIKPDGGIITNGLTIGRTHPATIKEPEDSGHWILDTRYPHLTFDALSCTFTIKQGSLYSTSTKPLLEAGTDGLSVTGNIHATSLTLEENATITGTVYATGGKIGDWTLVDKILCADTNLGATNNIRLYLSASSTTGFFIRAGNYNNDSTLTEDKKWGETLFGVSRSGQLVATGAKIQGSITASKGSKIGPWNITEEGLFYEPTGNGVATFINPTLSNSNTAFLQYYNPNNLLTNYNFTFQVDGRGDVYCRDLLANVKVDAQIVAANSMSTSELKIFDKINGVEATATIGYLEVYHITSDDEVGKTTNIEISGKTLRFKNGIYVGSN